MSEQKQTGAHVGVCLVEDSGMMHQVLTVNNQVRTYD